ncbi:unnamed protein product [Calypogeia fissa]
MFLYDKSTEKPAGLRRHGTYRGIYCSSGGVGPVSGGGGPVARYKVPVFVQEPVTVIPGPGRGTCRGADLSLPAWRAVTSRAAAECSAGAFTLALILLSFFGAKLVLRFVRRRARKKRKTALPWAGAGNDRREEGGGAGRKQAGVLGWAGESGFVIIMRSG